MIRALTAGGVNTTSSHPTILKREAAFTMQSNSQFNGKGQFISPRSHEHVVL